MQAAPGFCFFARFWPKSAPKAKNGRGGAHENQQDRSVGKLASFDFEHAVFGHGRAVSGRAVERFREYAASLA